MDGYLREIDTVRVFLPSYSLKWYSVTWETTS